jgi:cytoskeletal protein CcmA (bactofilin family)
MVFAKEAQSHNDRAVASTQGDIQKPLSIFGKIVGHGGLTIFGRVEGEVRASNVVIAEGAQIVGDVVAEELTINGHVKGTVHANRVRLGGAGVVEGDIFHRTLAIEENARFEGTSRRNENAIDAQSFVQTNRLGDQGTKSVQ